MKPAVDMFKRKYSEPILKAIDWAMEPDPRLRPQHCDELLAILKDLPPEEEPKSLLEKLNLNKIADVLPWKKSK